MVKLHNRKITAGLMLCMTVFAGCSAAKLPDVIENTSLSIDKTGTVTFYEVDVFDKEYYDLDEMEKLGRELAAAYNTEHQTGENAPVVLEEIAEVPGNSGYVMATYSYDSARTYQTYHERTLFYGTVEQAINDGWDFEALNKVLFNAKGDKTIVSSAIKDMSKKHVILLEEQTRVYCPYKVAYISEDARLLEDGSVDTSGVYEEEYPVIIVLDK